MSQKLWYITKYFAPQTNSSFGGRGHSLMKELCKLGYDITVITSNSNNLCELPAFEGSTHTELNFGYKIVYLNTLKYGVAKSARRILSWLHFEWNLFKFDTKQVSRPDVVIVSSLSLLTIFFGLYTKLRFGSKLIFEIRDIWPLTIIEEGGFSPKNPFVFALGIVEKIAYTKSDYIIGTMPNLIEHVNSISKKHPPVACIPMGIDLEVSKNKLELPQDYSENYLNSNYFNVVYAGTVGITNALEPFFEAAEQMKENTNIRFIVIGDGALKDEYMQKYNLPNLIFAPKIPRNMVQSALEKADLLYFSTYNSKVWDYGLSLNKLIDYMISSKPIIASYSGFPSMINEAHCGEFVPAFDTPALIKVINKYYSLTEDERKAIGQRGHAWIYKNRVYSRLALDYKNIIEKVLSVQS